MRRAVATFAIESGPTEPRSSVRRIRDVCSGSTAAYLSGRQMLSRQPAMLTRKAEFGLVRAIAMTYYNLGYKMLFKGLDEILSLPFLIAL
jgi:hypothetical protein